MSQKDCDQQEIPEYILEMYGVEVLPKSVVNTVKDVKNKLDKYYS